MLEEEDLRSVWVRGAQGIGYSQGAGCQCRAHLGHVQVAGLGRARGSEAGQQLGGGGRRVVVARRGQAGGAACKRQHLSEHDFFTLLSLSYTLLSLNLSTSTSQLGLRAEEY